MEGFMKRYFKILFVLFVIFGIAYVQFYMRRASAPQLIGKALLHVDTDKKYVALTFDDGPNPPFTDQILDVLDEYGAKATFFVVGQEIRKYPIIFKKIVDRGHEVGNHSWDHSRLTYKSYDYIMNQISTTDKLIRDHGYTGTIYFRAPFGHKLIVLPYILNETNRLHVLWNIELNDWDSPPPESMLAMFDEKISPGSIIVLHDGDAVPKDGMKAPRAATVEVTKLILEKYIKQGYRFVTISELLLAKSPYRKTRPATLHP